MRVALRTVCGEGGGEAAGHRENEDLGRRAQSVDGDTADRESEEGTQNREWEAEERVSQMGDLVGRRAQRKGSPKKRGHKRGTQSGEEIRV